MEPIAIRMLGEFSLQAGEHRISDSDNRTRKVWLLLAYLITHRGRSVSQKKLIELLWGEDCTSSNPENALRITFHRARTTLNRLWPTAGRDLIVHQDNGYAWNKDQSIWVDCDEFDALCNPKSSDEEQQLSSYLQALELYRGDFLEKQSSENWVIPICTHFHNQYISATLNAARLLSKQGRHEEAAAVCRRAIPSEPYHEELHRMLMEQLGKTGDYKGVTTVYEALSKRLFDDFGIRPNDETRETYRAAAHCPTEKTLPMDEVMEHLQEPGTPSGAMQCDYDYFKILCFAESRAMERSGKATHVVLLSMTSGSDKPLTRRSVNRIMEQLGEQIRTNLRRGDAFSRCSISQYIIMLPEANYENSCMVSRRILGAFHRAHPHISAKIHFMVQPLSPAMIIPKHK